MHAATPVDVLGFVVLTTAVLAGLLVLVSLPLATLQLDDSLSALLQFVEVLLVRPLGLHALVNLGLQVFCEFGFLVLQLQNLGFADRSVVNLLLLEAADLVDGVFEVFTVLVALRLDCAEGLLE